MSSGATGPGRILAALVATALAGTMCLGTYWTTTAMQSRLVDEARRTLEAGQLTAAIIVDGRDVYVWAETPTARADAVAALRTVPGLRNVLMGQGAPPKDFEASLSRSPDSRSSTAPLVRLTPTAGGVPGSDSPEAGRSAPQAGSTRTHGPSTTTISREG